MNLNEFFGEEIGQRYERIGFIKDKIKKSEKCCTIIMGIMSLISLIMMFTVIEQIGTFSFICYSIITIVMIPISGKILGKMYGWTYYFLKIRHITPEAMAALAGGATLGVVFLGGCKKNGILQKGVLGLIFFIFIGLYIALACGTISAIRYELEYTKLKKKLVTQK